MKNGFYHIDLPKNEPVLEYRKDSPERAELIQSLNELKQNTVTIHPIIDGEKITTDQKFKVTSPQDHNLVLAEYYHVGKNEIHRAIESSLKTKFDWAHTPWEERASIFLKAAALISGPYRSVINAATMLGQGKNVHQAEIDSACEWIDFLRFNVYFMSEIFKEQPYSPDGTWNRMDYRPLDGFVFAATPFNFTAIAGNLPTAPAMLGNTVVWKPATSGVYVAYFIMKILEEAGLPPGVINLVPGEGSIIGDQILTHPDLAGVHFTGSTKTFQHIWRTIGNNIDKYRSYPRIVGETGGKDFIFVHCSADTKSLATALIRGSFEYQGQKCSQASRAYIPECLWPELKKELIANTKELSMGPVDDFNNFINPVISREAFNKITSYIDYVKDSEDAEIIQGGNYDDTKGFYIEPTIVVTSNPRFKTMTEEIFGPVLTLYVYPDDKYEETLKECDQATGYGLTGSIFATDRNAIILAENVLEYTAGNFYINDKPTGAVVNQQPFGGTRASGTNDKAGSKMNLLRWISARAIKETFVPPQDYHYPFMK